MELEIVTRNCNNNYYLLGQLQVLFDGVIYNDGDEILTTPDNQVGTGSFPPTADPGGAVVCLTGNVNTECCRRVDGGNVGDWFLSDGTEVPNLRSAVDSVLFRSGFTHQVRLNFMEATFEETLGTYTCRVPDPTGTEFSVTVSVGKYTVSA